MAGNGDGNSGQDDADIEGDGVQTRDLIGPKVHEGADGAPGQHQSEGGAQGG
jgi:hypothetical protein